MRSLWPLIAVLLFGVPGAMAAESIPSIVSAAAESSHVICTGPCFVRSFYFTTGGTAGYLMTFDATSAPIDGAVTPRDCIRTAANTTFSMNYGETAEPYVTGMVVVFSSTGCFSKTASATAFFKVRKQ